MAADASGPHPELRGSQNTSPLSLVAVEARMRQFHHIMQLGTRDSDPNTSALPRWAIVGGVALLALTAAAAPFYGQVVGGLLWAGQSLKAICGW